MKGIKLYLLFMLAAVSLEGFAQQININAVPVSVEKGKIGYIEVSICNVDISPITAPANKLCPLISVPGNVTITGVTDVNGNALSGFTIHSLTSGSGNSIRLLATEPLPNLECFNFHVTIKGVSTGAADVVTGMLGFQGSPTPNDVPADNNSTAVVEVIAPLPITLVSFMVFKENQASILKWVNVTESDSDCFEIERSSNAKKWVKIGTVKSSEENKVLESYFFTDLSPQDGVNYYRLKIIGKENAFAYSTNVKLGDEERIVRLYPNPASEELRVEIRDWSTVSSVKLLDMKGGVIRQVQDAIPLDVKALIPGIYVVQVIRKNGVSNSHKVVITR